MSMAVTRRPLPIAQMEQLQRRVSVTAAGAHTEAGLNPVQDQRWPVVQSGPCRLWNTIEHTPCSSGTSWAAPGVTGWGSPP